MNVMLYYSVTTVMKHCNLVTYHTLGSGLLLLLLLQLSLNHTRLERYYSLEYIKIQKVFFTPHHGRRRQQGNQGNKKCNNGIKDNSAIQRHCCNNVIQAIVAAMQSEVIGATM
jgi:hypothetical protein